MSLLDQLPPEPLVLKECCRALISRYLVLTPAEVLTRPGIALYCPGCSGRIIHSVETNDWHKEEV